MYVITIFHDVHGNGFGINKIRCIVSFIIIDFHQLNAK